MLSKFISLIPYWSGVGLLALLLSKRQKKISQDILWASFRTTLQLIFLAFALELIFKSTQMYVSLGVALIMTFNSSSQIVARSKTSRYKIFWISFLSNVFSIWPIAFFFSWERSVVVSRWYEPMMLLPLLGMILGNTFNGVSIALSTYLETFRHHKNQVITLLSLGATDEEATRNLFYRSLKAGISPHINSMLAMGIVSIPGMMAGQLVAATSAMDASILQIKMMLSVITGTALCIYIALKFLHKKIFLPTGEICFE